MEINKESWNNFILANEGSFLQSFEWGEFQESAGRRVLRFSNCHPEFISGSKETLKQVRGDKIDWAAQFIEYKVPCVNKRYWYCPKGPVVANSEEQMAKGKIREIIEEVKKSAGEKVIFFRLGPEWPMANREELIADGFQQLPYDIEPSQTQILDITKTEDELLAQMHEKWRYNIRLAQKKGVQVKFINAQDGDFAKYFEEFYRLVSGGTSERKGIKHHPKDYYRKQLEINGEKIKFVLFVAEFENKIIAANIVVVFGKTATYLHGATSSELREVMAPHLLQWEQIKYAKSQGCAEYDFWGIVNEHTLDKRGASWEGFTRFKRGFGGQEVNYVGYWDYPLNRFWYFVYRLVQKFRR